MTGAALTYGPGRAACLGALSTLREQALQRSTKKPGISAAAIEWVGLPLDLRMAVLLLAGVDGDLSSLGRRAWGEFTPGERAAVQVATRGLIRALRGVVALVQS